MTEAGCRKAARTSDNIMRQNSDPDRDGDSSQTIPLVRSIVVPSAKYANCGGNQFSIVFSD
jgi:hypothetical protein